MFWKIVLFLFKSADLVSLLFTRKITMSKLGLSYGKMYVYREIVHQEARFGKPHKNKIKITQCCIERLDLTSQPIDWDIAMPSSHRVKRFLQYQFLHTNCWLTSVSSDCTLYCSSFM